MQEKIIFSGFGGQGILSAGRMLAYAGMIEGKNVSWLPSYGPEMRGGTANCHIVISDWEICSPIIDNSDAVIVMNKPSLNKFEQAVKHNGILIMDSSLIDIKPERQDITVFDVPATRIASDMNNISIANVILLGKLISVTNIVSKQSIIEAFKHVLPEKKHFLLPEEIKALEIGIA